MSERELFDSATGVAITLPADWEFFTEKNSLRAFSEDRNAMVFMTATERRFEEVLLQIEKTAGTRYFKDIEFTESTILLDEQRGALGGAVFLRGTAVDRVDDEPVHFAAMFVKSGSVGEFVFGSWRTNKHRDMVHDIVQSVRVRMPELESGLVLKDTATGATITLPDQWFVHGTRTGLMAYSPDRGAMTLIIKSDKDFRATRSHVRDILKERVFESVKVGRMSDFTAVHPKGFIKLMTADGTLKDRVTGEPAEFMVIAAERVAEQDSGVLILGVWKSEEYQQMVRKSLESLRLEKAFPG
jgi:hypothetical protein